MQLRTKHNNLSQFEIYRGYFDTEIFKHRITVIASKDDNELVKELNDIKKVDDYCVEDFGIGTAIEITSTHCVLAFKLKEELEISHIGHECLHAAMFILSGIGVRKIKTNDDEVLAYLQQYCLEQTLKILKKNSIIITT